MTSLADRLRAPTSRHARDSGDEEGELDVIHDFVARTFYGRGPSTHAVMTVTGQAILGAAASRASAVRSAHPRCSASAM